MEEILQQGLGFIGGDAIVYFRHMVGLRVGEYARAMIDAAGFGIGRAEIQAPDAGGGNGHGAHRARFQRDIEVMTGQPLGPKGGTGGADGEDFGMCGRVIQFAGAIAGLGDDFATGRDDHRADGNLATVCGGFSLLQGGIHMAGKFAHALWFALWQEFCQAAFHFRACGVRQGMENEAPKGERIAKVMARAGLASRREAERMIAAGRVTVNGKRIDSPALNVTPADKIVVDGKDVGEPEAPRLWLYHKPIGLVTTERDEKGRDTVFAALPDELPRVVSVGRLDINSEGLLLLTNDGGIKRKLELPSTGWLRRYRVRVNGRPSDKMLEPLRKGVTSEGERFQPMDISLDRQQGANAWLTVALREGKNREIRRALDEVGLKVNRLIRVSYGPFQLGELKAGEVEEIKPRVLRDQLGMGKGISQKPKPKPKRRRK